MNQFPIRPLTIDNLPLLNAHMIRHRSESGCGGDHHFMPFVPNDNAAPTHPAAGSLIRGLDELAWQRWFIAFVDDDTVAGHIDLKGDSLRTGLHRCMLGIGIERPYRGAGLGRRLMQTAIDFAKAAPSLEWVDLCVFGHNAPARALYRAMGFQEDGTIPDRFRIRDDIVDDVLMSLNVAN